MNKELQDSINRLLPIVNTKNIGQSLKILSDEFPNQITLSTSFSYEDQLITHEIVSQELSVEIFTLDTGRLFPETYSLWSNTNEQYHIKIKAYYPESTSIEKYMIDKGPNAFYDSVHNRKECCHIRKVEPLKRALHDKAVWVTGLRAEHSPSRHDLDILEWDEANRVIKYHPLLRWSTEDVKGYIHFHKIPYNPLHDKGFVSIGCAPCTRAIIAGEDFRAGRWWWEDTSKKECGLHARG